MSDLSRTVILFHPRTLRGIGEDSIPPTGLLMAAIHLYQEFRVVIVDQRIEKNWRAHLSELLKENPICIGITAMTGRQIKGGLYVSQMAKSKGCPVVWGGVHASLLPIQTLAHPLVDYVVEGEGEESFAELVEALASGRSCEKIPGVWSKNDDKPVSGGQRPFVDLNKLPPVPYHLIDLGKYIKPGPYGKSFILFTSRGCPQRCTFCFNLTFNQCHWRAFSLERILEDIKRIRESYPDVEHFEFWDDNFFVNLKRAREIAESIKQLRPSISWLVLGAHIHDISRMDDDYLACLRDSNLKGLLMGVESGSQRIIDLIQKNFTIEELFSANRRLGNYGIPSTYSFVSGIPGEDDEDIKKTIEAMFRLKKDNPIVTIGNVKPFICYPGTALYEKMTKLGFNPPQRLDDWSEYVWGNYINLEIPWVSHKRKRFLLWLYYYTILMNPGYMFIHSKIFTFITFLLRPIAEWRVKRFCFRFPLEAWFVYMVQRFIL